MNLIEQAFAEASAEDVKEFCKPFGVETLAGLMKEYSALKAFKTSRMKVEKEEAANKAAESMLTEAFETLKNAGIPDLTEKNDKRVLAYLKLAEEDRGDFVKTLMNKPIGSLRVGGKIEEKKSGMPEDLKKELVDSFPHKL